jgi:uncharacterized low-complexity protein
MFALRLESTELGLGLVRKAVVHAHEETFESQHGRIMRQCCLPYKASEGSCSRSAIKAQISQSGPA